MRENYWKSIERTAGGETGFVTGGWRGEPSEKLDKLICSSLFNEYRTFQLNVVNRGMIPNVLPEAVIETRTVVDSFGYHPAYFGCLPAGIAGICNIAATVQDLTAEAAVKRDRKLALQALLLDPLVYSLEPEAASKMLGEFLQAQAVWLTRFFN